jgi:hypothetical protein
MDANQKTNKLALYAKEALSPSNIAKTEAILKDSGFTTIMLGLFHIGLEEHSYPGHPQTDAEIFFNDVSIIQGGQNAGKLSPGFDTTWAPKLASLKESTTIKEIYASFGGGEPVQDFEAIRKIHAKNLWSKLEANLKLLKQTLPAIDGIDMDCEDDYDKDSFIAFCKTIIEMRIDKKDTRSLGLSFCPFDPTQTDFWVDALKQLEAAHPSAVKWWNLQCYAGGGANIPSDWATAIHDKVPKFETKKFILVSDWSEDSPQKVKAHLSRFKDETSVGGAFLWTLDEIASSASKAKEYFRAVREVFPPGK